MRNTNQLKKQQNEISALLNEFYGCMNSNHIECVFSMLSPNLKQLTLVEKHKAQFQKAFLFGREILTFQIHEMTAIKLGLLEATVIVGLMPEDDQKNHPAIDRNDIKPEELKYRIYAMRFIEIGDHWYIDDLYLNNDYQSTARVSSN